MTDLATPRPAQAATGPVLVIDDDPVQRRLAEAALGKFGYEVLVADGGEAGLAALDGPQGRDVSAVVLDLVMPGLSGLDTLARMRERGIGVPVVVQTSQGGIDTVIAAMRAGAFDFVVKPASPEKLRSALAGALKVGAMEVEQRRSARPTGRALAFRDMIAGSAAMERVIRLGRKAAASNIPILIEGESGAGKEIVARAIQGSGERRGKPFVTVNCGAIPDNLVESILFGHEKGSFTGAVDKHVGKFVEAHGGTLFLDEIGDLPLDVQVKLLRAVQDGEVDPVGGRSPVKVDIRLISATHRDLLQRVKDGLFREDLYYRLNVFPIFVPPLRERREDIPALTRHFIARLGKENRGQVKDIAPTALAMLAAHDWPGNIRQLENAIFRAVVLAEGEVLRVEDFPQIRAQVEGVLDIESAEPRADEVADRATGVDSGIGAQANEAPADTRNLSGRYGILRALDDTGNVRTLAEIELEQITLAIEHYNGQMSEVARRLGIGRSTLYRKLKEYEIDPEAGRASTG